MNGADGDSPCLSGWICLKEEMRAFFPGGLEDHALGITKIDAAVLLDAIRIDHEDIKVKAASSAAQADHAA